MAIPKVQPGQKVRRKASEWNQIVDAANAINELGVGPGVLSDPLASSIVVTMKNNFRSDIARFEVLSVVSPLSEPVAGVASIDFKNRPNAVSDLPTESDGVGRFGVAIEPVKSGELGRFVVAGVTPCQISVVDETHRFCDILNNNAVPQSTAGGGAAIIWKEAGLGTVWALIHLGQHIKQHFSAILGAATSIGTNRWRYAWEEARYSVTSDAFVTAASQSLYGLSSQTGGSEVAAKQARNRAEDGAGTHNAAAIGSGTVVEITVERDVTGNPVFTFELADCGCMGAA